MGFRLFVWSLKGVVGLFFVLWFFGLDLEQEKIRGLGESEMDTPPRGLALLFFFACAPELCHHQQTTDSRFSHKEID